MRVRCSPRPESITSRHRGRVRADLSAATPSPHQDMVFGNLRSAGLRAPGQTRATTLTPPSLPRTHTPTHKVDTRFNLRGRSLALLVRGVVSDSSARDRCLTFSRNSPNEPRTCPLGTPLSMRYCAMNTVALRTTQHKLLWRNDSATKLSRVFGKLRHVRSDWLSGSRTSET